MLKLGFLLSMPHRKIYLSVYTLNYKTAKKRNFMTKEQGFLSQRPQRERKQRHFRLIKNKPGDHLLVTPFCCDKTLLPEDLLPPKKIKEPIPLAKTDGDDLKTKSIARINILDDDCPFIRALESFTEKLEKEISNFIKW